MQSGALRNQFFLDYGIRLNPVNKGKDKMYLIDNTQEFLSKNRYKVVDNNNNKIHLKEIKNYMFIEGSVEKGKPEPDKREKDLPSNEIYYNTHSKEYSYFYAEHTCDDLQYYIADNLKKLRT